MSTAGEFAMWDVIIVGGSYAGLAAALQLGRARRTVLVVDAGRRRNRTARHSHGFLGSDGSPPDELIARARKDVLAYPSVTLREGDVSAARAAAGGFTVDVGEEAFSGRRLILATGVIDELPSIPGLAERWGTTAFHCPYCHGYELGKKRVAILGTGPHSIMAAHLVSEWAEAGGATFLLNDVVEPTATESSELAARGIRVVAGRVASVSGGDDAISVQLADGRTIVAEGLALLPRTRIATPFAEQLGCALEDGPLGPFLKVDATKETSVRGVFACGDAATAFASVSNAVADGAFAGVCAHKSLVFRVET